MVDYDDNDDDDDDNQGVRLGPPFDPSRFSDANMRALRPDYNSSVRLKGYHGVDDDELYGEDSSSDDDDEDEHGLVGGDANSTMAYAMQLARRDKQARLVERALAKIRRAQIQGLSKVKLSQRELDALEKRRQQDATVDGSKPKESNGQPAIDSKPVVSDKRIPGGYASSTGSPRRHSPTPGKPSSPSSQKSRSRVPSIKPTRMSQRPDTSPRNKPQQIYPHALPYSVPEDQTARQVPLRINQTSALDPVRAAIQHTQRITTTRHTIPMDATYQPVYRAMSGDSYMINHSSSDPFVVQHASRLCESPRSMRRSSGSSSGGDNGVHIAVENPSVPAGYAAKGTSGDGSGGAGGIHGRIRRRKRRH
ncbi:conserved hypothetical protein [Histoplasma capsulatum var. duboisii H88]|uniref:Prenylated Rab acceptor 1 n=1 Tax=Ajellomyces capsulatus (strain H88) TaxID=544711 RepID=F0U9W7_AJEC8|nr:conserved hypothetical protein [Histoplasma capsulatum var. duboisii H88]